MACTACPHPPHNPVAPLDDVHQHGGVLEQSSDLQR
jgi:hypothetical protein